MLGVVVVGGDFFCPLNDLVAKSHRNNLSRSSNYKNPDLKKFLCVTKQFGENYPIRFKLQIKGPMRAQTELFYKIENLGHPQVLVGRSGHI